jgi:hypothetical protein
MELSKDHHFNPCFWTANWTFDVLNALRSGVPLPGRSRDKVVYCWKLVPDKVLPLKTESVFVSKNANNVTVFHHQALQMIQQLAPGKTIIANGVDEQSTGAIYSVENLFTDIEELYQRVLLEVIKTGKIDDLRTKTMLCFFLFTQSLRNPSTWKYLKTSYANADPNEDDGMTILKMFIEFHRSLETHNQVMDAIMPFLSVKWVLYQTDRFLFPLSDHSLLMTAGRIMIPLAPDLLLEILTDQTISAEAVPCMHHRNLSYAQYRQFRYLSRLSSENEMIFGSERFFTNNWFDYHFRRKS